MNTRKLSGHESDNLARIHEAGLAVSLLFLTKVGLQKSILDSTEPMRRLFLEQGVHDYGNQAQGQDHKVNIQAVIFDGTTRQERRLSLYRPKTKDGDPRMWPSGFSSLASPDDVFAVFVHEKKPHFLNLSRSLLAHELDLGRTSLGESQFLTPLLGAANAVSIELLAKLHEIASKGPIKTMGSGSTAVGRSVEKALGIEMNPSPNPDYKGIELKSGRSKLVGAESRAHLFAQIPRWNLSDFQSIRELLDECGYERAGEKRLCCTVTSLRENPQGLVLKLDEAATPPLLEEWSKRHRRQVVAWDLNDLESRLRTKHRETFWIKARAIKRASAESFELLSVIHTRNPVAGQFARLLDSGSVTVDHEISGAIGGTTAHEHGPAFKVERARIGELFRGVPREYFLNE